MKAMRFISLCIFACLFLSACQLGQSPEDIAATMMAETAAAASPTPVPSETPQPTSTNTPLPPTKTPLPSATPTLTATPGPFTYADDFSVENKKAWGPCAQCEWVDGTLVVGPFEPGSNPGESLNFVLCIVCGEHSYYRMSVDVTFIDGQVDRFFGVVGPVTDDHIFYTGISPWQIYTIRDYDYEAGVLRRLAQENSSVVAPSTQTNHLEIEVKPASDGASDIYFTLNGKNVYILYGQSSVPSFVGLGMSFHSVTVAYDNFMYEETEVQP
ncbi:MAG: hypothetical protein CVU44_05655 [Chloroflexi bacterium HGW-Chloroflexi-6]|nr:MAG: hypothetical protein CVU44_05655 [Chloroflexi bacterium HGW-Chloroflexi-6]